MKHIFLMTCLLFSTHASAMGGIAGGILSFIGWLLLGFIVAGIIAYACIDWPRPLASSLFFLGLIVSGSIGFSLMHAIGAYGGYIVVAVFYIPITSAIFFVVMIFRLLFSAQQVKRPESLSCEDKPPNSPEADKSSLAIQEEAMDKMVEAALKRKTRMMSRD
jgi:hypothetical protein